MPGGKVQNGPTPGVGEVLGTAVVAVAGKNGEAAAAADGASLVWSRRGQEENHGSFVVLGEQTLT